MRTSINLFGTGVGSATPAKSTPHPYQINLYLLEPWTVDNADTRVRSRLKSTEIVQCYALKGDILEKDVFCELLSGELLKVGDMNVMVGSDHTLMGHVLGK